MSQLSLTEVKMLNRIPLRWDELNKDHISSIYINWGPSNSCEVNQAPWTSANVRKVNWMSKRSTECLKIKQGQLSSTTCKAIQVKQTSIVAFYTKVCQAINLGHKCHVQTRTKLTPCLNGVNWSQQMSIKLNLSQLRSTKIKCDQPW